MPIMRRNVNHAVAQKAASSRALQEAHSQLYMAKARTVDAERAMAFIPTAAALDKYARATNNEFGEKMNVHSAKNDLRETSAHLETERNHRKSGLLGMFRRFQAIGDKPSISVKKQKRLENARGSKLLGANKK